MNITKQEEINLDKKWSCVLTTIKQLVFTKAKPFSKEAQETIEILLKLMDETAKGKLDSIKKRLPFTEPISFPNPFTEKELDFLKEAINYYQNNN